MSVKIEDVMSEILKGDALKNAQDFVGHLRVRDFSIGKLNEADNNVWIIRAKSENVCCILLNGDNPDTFTVWVCGDHIGEHAGTTVDEHFKEVAWEHIFFPCGSCGSGCSPESRRKTVFGKQFDDVCTAELNVALQFETPASEILDCLKKIIDIRKNDILN